MASDILLECVRLGRVVRVAAVDPRSLAEVVFQAPAGTALADLERLARARLEHLRRRRKARAGDGERGPSATFA